MTHRRRTEGGQILVVVAGGLVGILAITALVLEGGTLFFNRRDAQNAADLASVAGARILALKYTDTTTPQTQANVFGAINASMNLNDCVSGGGVCTWDAQFVDQALASLGAVANSSSAIPSGAVGVRTGVTRTPGALIAHIWGRDTWTVSTEAVARTGTASKIPTGTMLPIAVCGWTSTAAPNDCAQASQSPSPGNFIDFKPFQIYDLTDGKDAPGGFGWLSWNGSNGAQEMADRICTPNNPGFTLDSPYDEIGVPGADPGVNPATGEVWFPIDPGKSNAGTVRTCLDHWIDSGATVLVPIYDVVTGRGNGAWYHVTGVAAFILTAREQPAIDQIQGMFVEYYPFNEVPGNLSGPPSPADISVFIGLVK
jgi:hypothetical protein